MYGKGICEKKPVGPEKLHDLPVAHTSQAIAFYQAEFFAQAADILKPDLVFHPVFCVAEPWGHGSAVKKDFSVVFNGYLDGFYVADGIGFALASYVGEGPSRSRNWVCPDRFFREGFLLWRIPPPRSLC